jgi:hypothetical protein
MATKPIICPRDCEEKHSEHRVTMAEVKKDLNYIKSEISDMKVILEKAMETKADKAEVDAINTKLWGFIIFIATLLLSVAGYLFVKWMESHNG